jgi:hypothetical protein
MHSVRPLGAMLVALAIPLVAQPQSGTTTRPKPSDYPVWTAGQRFDVGAEYMVRSFGQHNRMFTTDAYLVVEVALFPHQGQSVMVSADRFELHINGRDKRVGQSPQLVSVVLKNPDLAQPRGIQPEIGVGPVIIGGPPRVDPRYPGTGQPPPTRPQPAPRPDYGGSEEKETERANEAAVEFSLPEGPTAAPRSGYVYFAFTGRPAKIKKLELKILDSQGSSPVVVKLL